ncbi:AAA family ATPase [Asanoa siamensis]|uniref:Chaperone n=1 Tax=Asanoa siamensis TaxID=926357 RepID=A0ABQ4CRK5_9ACTN|nr:AAA family ATPase [Asanoa siamensis]GIF73915.1 chaperone [Asanoa siamensis]
MHDLTGWPAFAREIHATLPTHAQYVLWGNVHDSYLVGEGDQTQLVALPDLLARLLATSGYVFLLGHDCVDGPELKPAGPGDGLAAARALLGDGFRPGGRAPELPALATQLEAVSRPRQPVRAGVLLRAAQLLRSATDPQDAERAFLRRMDKLARTAQPVPATQGRTGSLYNPVFWLVVQEGELPAWFAAANDRVRSIALPAPDYGDRERTARLLLRPDRLPEDELAELAQSFAEHAEGLTLQGMIETTRLAHDRGLSSRELPDAARMYKLGVLDNPWRREFLRTRILAGEKSLPGRVIGQPQAVTKTLDILKRAALGLSGAQASRSSARPRGVLFFAGPTGVGKTELAKSVAQLVFGDENAYLRFDMSEFSAEHSGDRLIGAPPGYVGFEAGGELTNAVRQQPFRVILFDEIEKAHARILDKFLQILEDGRLTDGRGGTVHFSESILIFTSNLGMYVDDPATGTLQPTVRPGTPYQEVEQKVRAAIEDHFNRKLSRPELLNRLGDNIVVFNFVSPEAAGRIFESQLANILGRLRDEHDVRVTLADDVHAQLRDRCTADLVHGGRGIGSALETALVNPLARALFAQAPAAGSAVTVKRLLHEGGVTTVELA